MNDVENGKYLLPAGDEPIIELDGGFEDKCDKSKKRKGIIAIAVICILLCAAIAVVWNTSVASRQALAVGQTEQTDKPSNEWRGAFAERSIYEKCLSCSAVVRVERGSGEAYWSGFVFSEDGWIATSVKNTDRAVSGRIYVILGENKEYAVESMVVDSESSLALLKINESGMNAVDFKDGEMQNGERVFSFLADGNNSHCVLSGEIVQNVDGILKMYPCFDGFGSVGAPIFDGDGKLVGISRGADESGMLEVLSAEQIQNIFTAMRSVQK